MTDAQIVREVKRLLASDPAEANRLLDREVGYETREQVRRWHALHVEAQGGQKDTAQHSRLLAALSQRSRREKERAA